MKRWRGLRQRKFGSGLNLQAQVPSSGLLGPRGHRTASRSERFEANRRRRLLGRDRVSRDTRAGCALRVRGQRPLPAGPTPMGQSALFICSFLSLPLDEALSAEIGVHRPTGAERQLSGRSKKLRGRGAVLSMSDAAVINIKFRGAGFRAT